MAKTTIYHSGSHCPAAARPDMLQTGDPCPCCGQPIKTRDPELLGLLTYIRDSRCNQAFTHEYMDKRESNQ